MLQHSQSVSFLAGNLHILVSDRTVSTRQTSVFPEFHLCKIHLPPSNIQVHDNVTHEHMYCIINKDPTFQAFEFPITELSYSRYIIKLVKLFCYFLNFPLFRYKCLTFICTCMYQYTKASCNTCTGTCFCFNIHLL